MAHTPFFLIEFLSFLFFVGLVPRSSPQDAVVPDNIGTPETILVITDGAPEDRAAVEVVIQMAADALVNPDDLRIVFVQVGNDPSATRWLSNLDDNLDCKFDIVDVITSEQLLRTGVPFAQWVARSVMPDLLLSHMRPGGASPSKSQTLQLTNGGGPFGFAGPRPSTAPNNWR